MKNIFSFPGPILYAHNQQQHSPQQNTELSTYHRRDNTNKAAIRLKRIKTFIKRCL